MKRREQQKTLCSKGGWQTLYGIGGTEYVTMFTGQQDCISFAANGGTLKVRFGSLVDRENLGGTYNTDPDAPWWRCLGVYHSDQDAATAANQLLIADCFGEGSNTYQSVGNGTTLDAWCHPYASG